MSTTKRVSGCLLPSPMLGPATPEGAEEPGRVKFIIVTGGVCSSLGKGVTTSSVGALLRAEGFRVCSVKIDPYINIDAGLMSPFEHGEVYVLADGGEVDLDLGNYERWLSVKLRRDHNITTGKVYNTLINRERQGKYLGKTVQVVPHFTKEVVDHLMRVSQIPVDGSGLRPQICMIELGGTVGDLESAPFLEALRQLRFTLPPEDLALIHCTYLPSMGGGQKTKPTQHSCRALLSLGLTPDLIVCRSEAILQVDARKKLSQQCGIQEQDIIGAHNVPSLYQVPVEFHRQGIIERLYAKLHLGRSQAMLPDPSIPDVNTFARFANILQNTKNQVVRIAFVGKYVSGGSDAYFSVLQTFEHCCIALEVRLDIIFVDSEMLEGEDSDSATATLLKCDGIYVAGGFGVRGINGKVAAARLAREKNIPYFGVCLGMQIALVELARSLLNLADANSAEFDPNSTNQILKIMDCDRTQMGANMHLGVRDVHIVDDASILSKIYGGAKRVHERHRHRYEFNMSYFQALQDVGVKFTGVSDPTLGPQCRVESFEIPNHKFFFAVQYHPEFITTPVDPSPPYLAFIEAASGKSFNWPAALNSRAVE